MVAVAARRFFNLTRVGMKEMQQYIGQGPINLTWEFNILVTAPEPMSSSPSLG